ncbi:MAG: methyltransferase domain-containing protein [Lachnospiraceae bacterium]|nr:methyltransferase domain-containing protein [Lachnospiraceae bacterium]
MRIIIFGAGNNGRKLLKIVGKDNVVFFADNDPDKIGKMIESIECISFDYMCNILDDNCVILSVDNDDMRNQLHDSQIKFYECTIENNGYFVTQHFITWLDDRIWNRYLDSKAVCYTGGHENNWFRDDFFSDENERLVYMMKNNDIDGVDHFLNEIYKNDDIYYDELLVNRPGMRLIARIILQSKKEKTKRVCDVACGHGDLLKYLHKNNIDCIGIDNSEKRVAAVNALGINCNKASVYNTGLEDNYFDYVVCMECLEHLIDPFRAIKEIKRILKHNGIMLITVPYANCCDCRGHVRQFKEADLYSVARENGFNDIKIFRIPYLNNELDNNLFMEAKVYR